MTKHPPTPSPKKKPTPKPCPQCERLAMLEAVYNAARGLCFGYDWNEGTHAKLHGYRNALIDAVDAIEKIPDKHGHYRGWARAAARRAAGGGKR